MKSPKKTIDITKGKNVQTANPKLLEKLKGTQTVNFALHKNVDFNEIEIRITIKGNEIVAAFWNKGVLETQQALPIKPRPTPPPVDTDIIKAIKKLQLIFTK